MSNTFMGTNAICPFYITDSNQEICCEGFEEGVWIHYWFRSQKKKEEWARRKCCQNDYLAGCELAKALQRYHERGKEGSDSANQRHSPHAP